VEGFKTERHPKLEVFRAAVGKTPLHPEDRRIVAIASDQQFPDAGIPIVDINDIAAVGEMVLARAEPLAQVLAVLESPAS
jgi:molybdopterin-guanine dinucleotide biosynthesis protein B